MKRILIAGVGTGIGKTVFSGLLAGRLRADGMRVHYIKPVQTGSPPDDDAAEVRALSGLPPKRTETLYTALEPVSPCFVFDPFPFEAAATHINAVRDCDVLLVECAGGLCAPLSATRQNWHLAAACELETILVVPNRLGCLSDALAYAAVLARENLPYALAWNEYFPNDAVNRTRNRDMLARLLPGRVRLAFDEDGLSDQGLADFFGS